MPRDRVSAAAQPQEQPPVFILTTSRSGSTLLRFILDSHPALACPPETGIATAVANLARTWLVLESAGSGSLVPERPELPLPAKLALRDAAGRAYGHYLGRRGKRRWCDKSLDTYQHAGLLAEVYPEAQFICLHRHCMDVVASGVEACPWGVHRFGFDAFVAQHPGNSVAAIASYWVACTQAITAFAAAHPQACHQVRYEDLVTAPEETAAAVFRFLGVADVPGITEACFQVPHEGEGPGDEKIWFTTRITAGSLGRGVNVPVAAVPEPVRAAMNELHRKLGYRLAGDDWNAAAGPADPRAAVPAPPAFPAAAGASGRAGAAGRDSGEVAAAARALTGRLHTSGEDRQLAISRHWPGVAGTAVTLIVRAPGGSQEKLLLRFPPLPGDGATSPDAAGPVTPPAPAAAAAGGGAAGGAPGHPGTTIVAEPAVWESLLRGEANLVTELTAGRLRCVNQRDAYRLRSEEVHAMAALLGLAQLPTARGAADTALPAGPAVAAGQARPA